ncbi:MAG: hypothetical protein IJT77_00140, partial [Clostridia bacterium]|nr:hypothetical protein [Clostridia bacterium]
DDGFADEQRSGQTGPGTMRTGVESISCILHLTAGLFNSLLQKTPDSALSTMYVIKLAASEFV